MRSVSMALLNLVAVSVLSAQSATLEDLSWLAGSWSGTADGTHSEEVWMEPRGGVMVGMHRDVFASGRFFHENLLITQTEEGLVYLASPGGRMPPTPFPLAELSARRVVFANPDHDFPQRLTYELDGETLVVTAEGEQGGRPVRSQWRWAKKR